MVCYVVVGFNFVCMNLCMWVDDVQVVVNVQVVCNDDVCMYLVGCDVVVYCD